MAATDIPPNLTNNPALVRALIGLLLSQPNRTNLTIKASGQKFTRKACKKAVENALQAFMATNSSLVDRHPDLADFTKYADEQSFLEDAWRAVNEFIVSQQPEGNLPPREQLEYWMNQMELDRLERLAANPNKDSSWRAETLTLEQMQELMDRARAWDEARLKIHQAAFEAVINDLPPEAQASAAKNEALQTLTDIPAHETTQRLAADLETGVEPNPAATIEVLKQSSPATNVVTATSTGSATFHQGLTQVSQQIDRAPEQWKQAVQAHRKLARAAAPSVTQLVQKIQTVTGVNQAEAVKVLSTLEHEVAQNQPHQTALVESLAELKLAPGQAQKAYNDLAGAVEDYVVATQDLRIQPVSSATPATPPLSQAELTPSPTAAIPLITIHALNEHSFADNNVIITHAALELHQLGVDRDTFDQVLAQSPHPADFNPELITQTKNSLDWLAQHPELVQQFDLQTHPPPLAHFAFEMDTRPWGSTEYFHRRFQAIDQQLALRNAQGVAGWLKAPRLKWQAGWAKLAANHPKLASFAGFLGSPKRFIVNKIGGKLLGVGARWAIKKGVKGLIGKGIVALGSNILPGVGQVLSVLMLVDMLHDLAEQIPIIRDTPAVKALSFLKRNWKKIAAGLAGFLAFLIGLIAKTGPLFSAGLASAGVWFLAIGNPFVGLPLLVTGGLGLAKFLSPLVKGGLSGLANGLASGVGNFLGLSTTAAVPAYVMAAPFVAIGGLVVVNIFSNMVLTSAFVLPPSESQRPLETIINPATGKPMGCKTDSFPLSGTNTATNPIARRAWEIVKGLEQGFWCYWNRSPDFPDLFNLSLYQTTPFPPYPSEINQCADCLFWCTWLVQKAYGGGIPNALSAQAMMDSWPNPLISADKATPENVRPGGVIFFETSTDSPGVDHVAIVYSVSEDSIVYVQSNSLTRRGSLTFNDNGIGVQSLPGIDPRIEVVNFGAP